MNLKGKGSTDGRSTERIQDNVQWRTLSSVTLNIRVLLTKK
jgi:hypothetical protein